MRDGGGKSQRVRLSATFQERKLLRGTDGESASDAKNSGSTSRFE